MTGIIINLLAAQVQLDRLIESGSLKEETAGRLSAASQQIENIVEELENVENQP